VAGFIGNEIAAQIRLRAGARLDSPALTAAGARTDGLVSLTGVASSIVVALGFKLGDPIIGLTITLTILRITWQSIQTITTDHRSARGEIPTTVMTSTTATTATLRLRRTMSIPRPQPAPVIGPPCRVQSGP